MTEATARATLDDMRTAWAAYDAHTLLCGHACSQRRPDGSPVALCGEGAVLWDTFTRRAAAFAGVTF